MMVYSSMGWGGHYKICCSSQLKIKHAQSGDHTKSTSKYPEIVNSTSKIHNQNTELFIMLNMKEEKLIGVRVGLGKGGGVDLGG